MNRPKKPTRSATKRSDKEWRGEARLDRRGVGAARGRFSEFRCDAKISVAGVLGARECPLTPLKWSLCYAQASAERQSRIFVCLCRLMAAENSNNGRSHAVCQLFQVQLACSPVASQAPWLSHCFCGPCSKQLQASVTEKLHIASLQHRLTRH